MKNLQNIYNFKTILLLSFIVLILPFDAIASTLMNSGLEKSACRVVLVLQGTTGKVIAIVAVIFGGIALFLGKMSWSVALSICLGIACIFGASTIVQYIAGLTDALNCQEVVS